MNIALSKAKIYILVAIILALLLGAGIGFHLYQESKQQKEAQQRELQRIKSAKIAYGDLINNIEDKLTFSIVNYSKVDDELSHLNLLGWQPVEFICQSIICEYTLNTDNKHYVGIPKLTLGYSKDNIVISENNLIMKDIRLPPIRQVVNELFFEQLPHCTSVLTDLRKFIDVASFVLSTDTSHLATFSFLQPVELVKDKNLLKQDPFLDIYGIDWSAENLDRIKRDYFFRYILSRENVGVSAIRKIFGSNGSQYNMTGTVYCKVN